jgi:hypothetical protein
MVHEIKKREYEVFWNFESGPLSKNPHRMTQGHKESQLAPWVIEALESE